MSNSRKQKFQSQSAPKESYLTPIDIKLSPLDGLKLAAQNAKDNREFEVPIAQIDADEADVQVRVNGLDDSVVESYVAIIENAEDDNHPFPGVILYVDDPQHINESTTFYLADGFHRLQAHIIAGENIINGIIRGGGKESAIKFAEEANLEHGLQLSNADKKNILFRALSRKDPEWLQLSNVSLGSKLGVSEASIRRWVNEYTTSTNDEVDRTQTVGKDGKIRDTSNIGSNTDNTSTTTSTNDEVESTVTNGTVENEDYESVPSNININGQAVPRQQMDENAPSFNGDTGAYEFGEKSNGNKPHLAKPLSTQREEAEQESSWSDDVFSMVEGIENLTSSLKKMIADANQEEMAWVGKITANMFEEVLRLDREINPHMYPEEEK